MSRVNLFTSISNLRPQFSFLRILVSILFFIIFFHIFSSVMVVTYLGHFHSERMINLKKWKDPLDWELISGAYARQSLNQASSENKKSIFFIGSSVTYGFPYDRDSVFTEQVAFNFPAYQISNFGAVGFDMNSIADFIGCSFSGDHVPDVLFVEIPLVNSTASLNKSKEIARRQCRDSSLVDFGFWGLVFSHPLGFQWISLIWEEIVRPDHGRTIEIKALPEDFFLNEKKFSEIEEKYKITLSQYIHKFSSMGGRVIFYVSPIYTPGLDLVGGDRLSVERQIQISQQICSLNHKVECLNIHEFLGKKELYSNLTHFNLRGHHEFGAWLSKRLAEII